MYFNMSTLRSQRATSFQRLLPKLGSQVHFNNMRFSFAAKMAADTNQLKNCVSKRRQEKQVQNKERHFEEVAKGKVTTEERKQLETTRVTLSYKATVVLG